MKTEVSVEKAAGGTQFYLDKKQKKRSNKRSLIENVLLSALGGSADEKSCILTRAFIAVCVA